MDIKATLTVHKWDTDEEKVKLPKVVKLEMTVDDSDSLSEIHDQAMDDASDKFGWCIESCTLTNVKIC